MIHKDDRYLDGELEALQLTKNFEDVFMGISSHDDGCEAGCRNVVLLLPGTDYCLLITY